jgi:hypothetical protein
VNSRALRDPDVHVALQMSIVTRLHFFHSKDELPTWHALATSANSLPADSFETVVAMRSELLGAIARRMA